MTDQPDPQAVVTEALREAWAAGFNHDGEWHSESAARDLLAKLDAIREPDVVAAADLLDKIAHGIRTGAHMLWSTKDADIATEFARRLRVLPEMEPWGRAEDLQGPPPGAKKCSVCGTTWTGINTPDGCPTPERHKRSPRVWRCTICGEKEHPRTDHVAKMKLVRPLTAPVPRPEGEG